MIRNKFKNALLAVFCIGTLITIVGCGSSFPSETYKVTVVDGLGSGTYYKGSEVTIEATPQDNQNFKHWLLDDGKDAVSSEIEYSFKVDKNVKYTAVYEDKFSQVTIIGGGYDVETGKTSFVAEVGTQVTIKSEGGGVGHTFESFSINGNTYTSNPCTFTVEAGPTNIITNFKDTAKSYIFVNGGTLNGEEVTGAVEVDNGEEVTIKWNEKKHNGELYLYFRGWAVNNEFISPEEEYTFTVTESLFIDAKEEGAYEVEIESGVLCFVSPYDYYGSAEILDGQTKAFVFENVDVTLNYVRQTGDSGTSMGFRNWVVDDQIFSYDVEHTFLVKNDVSISANRGETTMYEVSVENGYIEGIELDSNGKAEIIVDREITVVATNPNNGEIFQGWRDGTEHLNGTEVINSYNPFYTFTIEDDINLHSEYSNRLMVADTVNADDLVIYALNTNNFICQYVTFLNASTNTLANSYRTVGLKFYFYTSPNDDREDYVATATTTGKKVGTTTVENVYYLNEYHESYNVASNHANCYLFTFEGINGEVVNVLSQNWNSPSGGLILLEGGFTNAFWSGMAAVIPGLQNTTEYFAATQLIADTGYENSQITDCSRVALVRDLNVRTNDLKENSLQTPSEEYSITTEVIGEGTLSNVATTASFGDEVTFTASAGNDYEVEKIYVENSIIVLTPNDEGVYTLKMPRSNVKIIAKFRSIIPAEQITITVNGGTVDGVASKVVETGTKVVLKATTGNGAFQGWSDGTLKADGTQNIVSYATEYEYLVPLGSEDLNFTASYDNKLVAARDGKTCNINDIFRYSSNYQYLEFLRFSNVANGTGSNNGGAFNIENVDYIVMYVYSDVDADRSDWLAKIEVRYDNAGYGGADINQNNTFTITSKDESLTSSIVWATRWQEGGGIYFNSNGQIASDVNNNIYTLLRDGIANYDATANYFFAMQLIATEESGYANSDITSCSRIAFTQSGTKSDVPVA